MNFKTTKNRANRIMRKVNKALDAEGRFHVTQKKISRDDVYIDVWNILYQIKDNVTGKESYYWFVDTCFLNANDSLTRLMRNEITDWINTFMFEECKVRDGALSFTPDVRVLRHWEHK